MNQNSNTPPQSSLMLRIVGGGYLMYLAWDTRGALETNPLFLIPILIFAVVGLLLTVHSLWTLYHHGYFRKDTTSKSETESNEDWEDETNE